MRRFLFLLIAASFAFASCAAMRGGVIKQELAAEYMELADAYAAVKKYDKAATYYERAGRHKAYYNATQYKLARMYALSSKWDRAVEVLEPLYLQDPDNVLISTSYSFALVSLGELDKALPIYEKNHADNADNPVQARNYAEILFLAGRWDDCIAQTARLREQFGDAEELSDLDDLEKRVEAAIKREKKEADKNESGDVEDSSVPGETGEADGQTEVDDKGGTENSE